MKGADISAGAAVPNTEHHVVSQDGTSIFYRRLGRGPRVLLVHGSLGTGDSWRFVAPELHEDLELIALDRRAHGRSDAGSSPYAIVHETEDVEAVLADVGGVAAIFGHSFGATVALEFARSRSDRTGKIPLVLYEPGFIPPGLYPAEAVADFRSAVDRGDLDAALEISLVRVSRLAPEDVEAVRHSPAWGVLAALAPTHLPEIEAMRELGTDLSRYRAVQQPALLIEGDLSSERHRAVCAELRRVLPNVHPLVLEGEGHLATLSSPTRIAAAILRFMGEHLRERRRKSDELRNDVA